MPMEYAQLLGQPVALAKCPRCGKPIEGTPQSPYEPFMRGMVHRTKYTLPWIWKRRPYCAVICYKCKKIIDWEEPFEHGEAHDLTKRGAYRTPGDLVKYQPLSRDRLSSVEVGYIFAPPLGRFSSAFWPALAGAIAFMVNVIATAFEEVDV